MSPRARALVEQCMFWLERARAGSINAGRPAFWESQCRELAAELIGAGCAPAATAGPECAALGFDVHPPEGFLGPRVENATVDKQQWSAFVGDRKARKTSESRWRKLHAKLVEAERLALDEGWTTDDPWPGVIYRGPTRDGLQVVDVETWAFMRALVRGMGEQLLRQDKRTARGAP